MHKIKIEQFEGPLDLLLQLIEQEKMEITQVSLAQVTEQYIAVLKRSSERTIPADELADFLVVAARLLLIKSRALLPFLHWEEEEEEPDLASQLKIYREYLEAMKVLQKMMARRRYSYGREKLLVMNDVGFQPPPKLTASRLGEVFREIIRGLGPVINLPVEVIQRTVHLQEKIQEIKQRLAHEAQLKFSDMLKQTKNKTEAIVSFLAVLELMKQHSIIVRQTRTFDDILIEKHNS